VDVTNKKPIQVFLNLGVVNLNTIKLLIQVGSHAVARSQKQARGLSLMF